MKTRVMVLAVVMLLSQGCVMGRRTMSLATPAPEGAAVSATRGKVCVAPVVDNRVFQNKPPKPWMPSVKGDVHKMKPEQRSMMIGRQRNSYGAAIGDIALREGDNVMNQVRSLVEAGLKQRGYEITSAPAGASASVSIDEFWAWFTPGFWSVDFEARVSCTITFNESGNTSKVVVKGYGKNMGQIAADRNWQQAYDRAFKDFLTNLDAELDKVSPRRT